MNGLTTILDHKKWIFAYVVLAICLFKLDGPQFVSILIILIPSVLTASTFDKSQWRKGEQ